MLFAAIFLNDGADPLQVNVELEHSRSYLQREIAAAEARVQTLQARLQDGENVRTLPTPRAALPLVSVTFSFGSVSFSVSPS